VREKGKPYTLHDRYVCRRVAAFVGVENLTEEEVEAVAEATSFQAMKANPLTNYSHWESWGLSLKSKRETFMRKGEVGDYANHELDHWTSEEFEEWIRTGLAMTKVPFRFSINESE